MVRVSVSVSVVFRLSVVFKVNCEEVGGFENKGRYKF